MPPSIELLSEETINQIAAGEVVEGPASVVKELVENALDAEASLIKVQVVGGGLQSIVVADDGWGMEPEDARRSVVRHATSKIRTPQDLFRIPFLGFRGEGLSSIASISQMTIDTSPGGVGMRLEVVRGEVVRASKRARARGTTITVRQLFHNVPARKKFQKGPAALSAEVFRVMTGLALGHPQVQFELVSNGRKAIHTGKTETLEARALSVLGKPFAEGALPIDFQRGPLCVRGLLGSPAARGRPNRMAQYLFLNRRSVVCPAIAEGVRKGYGTRLEEHRHPLFLLHLDAPTDLIDVNVHPQKLHVRLRKEELFVASVSQAVEGALSGSRALASPPPLPFTPTSIALEDFPLTLREDPLEDQLSLPIGEDPVDVLGFFDHFMICRRGGSLELIDAAAASFRVCFEEVLNTMDQKVATQQLLIPMTVDLTAVESAMVLTHQAAIEQVGFALKAIGKDVMMVEAAPPFLSMDEIEATLTEIASALQAWIGKVHYDQERREALALIVASRGKSGRVGSAQEAKELLRRLAACESSDYCPKGKNVRIQLDVATIEGLFRAHRPPAERAK